MVTIVRAGESYKYRFSYKELELAYAHAIVGRTSIGKDLVSAEQFGKQLDEELNRILNKVGKCTHRFTDYRQLLISKGPNKVPREVCIPTTRDMLVLIALKDLLKDSLGLNYATPKPQRVIAEVRNALASNKYDYYIKMDIKQYYASIQHEIMMRILRRKIRKPQVLHLIRDAIETPSTAIGAKRGKRRTLGLPEGLPISNILANLYLTDIDQVYSANVDIAYHRYVDDILILCDSAYAAEYKKSMQSHLKRLGLELNEKTSQGFIKQSEIGYLGYVFHDGNISVREASIRRLEQRIETLLKRIAHAPKDQRKYLEFKLRLTITGCYWQEEGEPIKKYGWVTYYSQADDISCFARLDHTARKLDMRYGSGMADRLPSFRKILYESKYRPSTTDKIPVFGSYTPKQEKRRILELVGIPNVKNRDDDWVDRAFSNRIRSLCRSLDRDVGSLS